MRDFQKIFTTFLFVLIFAAPLKAEEFNYLTTSLSKSFKSIEYPYKNVETKITIKTRLNDDDLTEPSILRTRDVHKKYLNAFYARGWNKINPLTDYLDAGDIEVTQEDRMNLKLEEKLVLKSYLYVCENTPPWNMMKYRGGDLNKYLDSVIDRAEGCVISNQQLKNE